MSRNSAPSLRRETYMLTCEPLNTYSTLWSGLRGITQDYCIGRICVHAGLEGIESCVNGTKSAPGRIRTCDQEIRRLLLYPLSYGGAWNIILEGSGCDACRPTPTRCRSRFAKVLPLRYGYTRPRADRFLTGVHSAQRCTRFFDRHIRGQWTHRRAHRSRRGGILRVAGTDSSGHP